MEWIARWRSTKQAHHGTELGTTVNAADVTSRNITRTEPPHTFMTDTAVHVDKDQVVGTVMDFKEYKIGTRTLRELPRFDNCHNYGVPESTIRDLLMKEIDKIIDFSESDNPPLFDSDGSLGGSTPLNFAGLSGLADQITCNLFILHNDNARAVVDRCGSRVHSAWNLLMRSRDVLQARYGRMKDETNIEGNLPVVLDNEKDNCKAYMYLVDYIFGAIAWWLIRSVENPFLQRHVFAILAQWSLKLKLVVASPGKHAEQALSDTQDILLQYKDLVSWSDDTVVLKLGNSEKQINVFNDDTDLTRVYFEEKILLRSLLENILHTVVAALMHSPRYGAAPDCFEVCTLIYPTGRRGITTMAKSLRNGNVMATSNLAHISFCHSAYRLLSRNTKALPQSTRSPPCGSSHVVINCNTTDDQDLKSITNIHTIDQMVSILVPNAMMNADVSRSLEMLINMAAVQASFEEQIAPRKPPPKDFYLEYTIRTNTWVEKQQPRLSSDITPLSESNLRRGTSFQHREQ